MFKNRNRFKFRYLDQVSGESDDSGTGNTPPTAEANPPSQPTQTTPNQPSDKEAELLKEVMKRKEREKQLAEQLNQLQGQLKQFEGVDLGEVRKLLDEKKTRETEELERRGEFDRVKAQMVKEHQEALERINREAAEKTETLASKLSKLNGEITELTIGRAFGDSPFIRELTLTPAKARVVYGSHFEVQDGQVVAFDKPAGAKDRTILVDGTGSPLPFDKAIEKIVDADPDKDQLLRSRMRTGSGSNNEAGAKPTPSFGSGRDRIAAAIAAGALKQTSPL
jgi:TolA-binding protein